MSGARLLAGGPHYYTLRADSHVGGELYERRLLERLPAHGVEVRLGLPRDHEITAPPPGWTIDVLDAGRDLHWTRAPLLYVPYAVRLIRRHGVDLLRGHSVRYSGPSLLMARSLTRAKTPVVLHHHHLDARWHRLEAAIATRADAVITVSEHSRSELVAAGARPERVHVALQGIDRPPPTSGWPEAWPGDGLRLLGLGRLEPRKRPGLAIEALAALARGHVSASLVLAGEGPEAARLRELAATLGVEERVRFLPRVCDEDKWRLYDSAHALVFGSTLEGFGLVVAEAQSRGVPVVAAAGTATAEALDPGQSGFLVAPAAEAFAARLAELADENLRARMAARAREFGRRFDADVCAAAVAGVYRAAVEAR